MTLIAASTMVPGWRRRRFLTSARCDIDNGATSSICDCMVRSCAMTASADRLTALGFVETGVVLLMTYPPYASCQAGGDVTTRRQVRERPPAGSFGDAPILPVDDYPRYVHTSRARGRRR